ncbi:MAG: tyrosine-type recombinase/integrase [Phycisphaerae bacterium]
MVAHHNLPEWPFKRITKMTAHPRGQWFKRINYKSYYFGAWANPDPKNAKATAALDKYMDLIKRMREAEANSQGLPTNPVVPTGDMTLGFVVNSYMDEKNAQVERGDLSARQFVEYRNLGTLILNTLGRQRLVTDLTPTDFTLLRTKLPGGPVRVGNAIVWCRSIFKWVTDNHGVVIKYGAQFDKPSRRSVRKSIKPKGIYTAESIKAILNKANDAVKAMILLGINAGFGQTDIATLQRNAVNFDKMTIELDRNKTGVRRIVPLWQETVDALKAYQRPHAAHPELFFVTHWGNPWMHEQIHRDADGAAKKVVRCDAVDLEFDKAQKAAGLPLHGFYLLRHTFRTVADDTGDLNAIRVIMGHAFPGMDEFYLHISSGGNRRLRRVADYVHDWLYGVSSIVVGQTAEDSGVTERV